MDEPDTTFEFTGNVVDLSIPTSAHKKRKVQAGIFKKADSPDQDFFKSKNYPVYINKTTVEDRLAVDNENMREADFDKVEKDERPFDLWDNDGDLCNCPAMLIPTRGGYDDKRQLKVWSDFASFLVTTAPPKRVHPTLARFLLQPSAAGPDNPTLTFTPASPPQCGVDTDVLKTVITNNEERFKLWKYDILTYDEAKKKGLKLVGTNFVQLYHTWMDASQYRDLWKRWGEPPKLAFPFPTDKSILAKLKVLDTALKKGKLRVEGMPITISTVKMEKAKGMRNDSGKPTKTVMGKSATDLVQPLWGDKPSKTGMGNDVQAEWLHRSCYAYGGLNDVLSLKTSDDPDNLVFGSWECNTDMIRAENFVTQLLLRKDKKEFKGILTTTSTDKGEVTRRTITLKDTKEIIPSFLTPAVKTYSWLCLELDYVFTMKAADSPLDCDLNARTKFEPWSLYVPLAIEPRLDVMLINHFKGKFYSTTARDTMTSGLLLSQPTSLSDQSSFMMLPGTPSEPDLPSLAWNAAKNALPILELPGLVVKNPKIAEPLPRPSGPMHAPGRSRAGAPQPETPAPTNPTEGYVLQGDVSLFDTPIVGQLEKWMGPPPEGVVIGSDPPCIERVTLPTEFHISALIPLLKDTPFDEITFRNVVFYYQNYAFDKTKAIGWHFNADWVIDRSSGVLYDVLKTVLQVDAPDLGIHAMLGLNQQWNAPLNIHSFTLEGVFSGLTIAPIPGIHLTSIGVRLLGIRGFELTPEPHATLSYGFGVFGAMKLDVPGSVVPLDLMYEIGAISGYVNMSTQLSGDIWENALGVQNLMLEDVLLTTSFSTSSPWKSLVFGASATFTYLTSQAILSGTFSPGGQFTFTAEFDDFGTQQIDSIFYTLFGDSLTLPDFEVHVDSAVFSIVSGDGVSLSLHNVKIAEHTALNVAVSLSKSGAHLSGALTSKSISFGEVSIQDAVLQVSFWTEQKKKQVDLMLGGTLAVDFLDLTIEAAVHLYPGEKGVDWAIVGKLSAPNKSIAISDVVSPIEKGSFLDLSLKQAVIIAASKDDPSISEAFPGYTVRQGIQVVAIIDSLPVLDELLRNKVSGLILSAGWSKSSGFDLKIALPASTSLNLGNGIKTTPIALEIRTQPLELAVMAGLTVPVKDSTPLDFSFVLAANITEARASAEMKGWWVKPFGIDNLKIGPTVALSIEIIYAQFVSTGTPSGFGVVGGLMIGSIPAQVAMNISEDPQRELLSGSVKNLGVSDLVKFAGELIQDNIPKVPDVVKFENLSIYICPFGVVVGTTTYPAGFSFNADLVVLQKKANIDCKVDKANKSISIAGGVDNFELGPLSVHGSKGPRAELECELGVSKQELLVDGVVSLLDTQAQVYINLQFLPNPKLKFYTLLQFADVLTYQLDAELLGSLGTSLKDADFSVSADLENHILEYVAQQIMEQLEAAKVAADQGIDAAQKKVDEAKRQWQDGVNGAQAKLNDAQKTWESYEKSIQESSQPVIDHWLNEISRLQGNIDQARRDFDNAMRTAESAVERANCDRAAAMAAAERDVKKAETDMENGINAAERDLDNAKAALSAAFGDAQQAIDSAQQAVDSIDSQIENTMSTIRDYENASGWEFWKKAAIPGLYAYVGTLQASKLAATGTLDVARGILKGSEYLSKEGAIETAKGVLELAKKTGRATLEGARLALTAADKTSQLAMDQANNALKAVQTGTEYVALQGAIEALEVFKNANKAAYDAAVAAIDGLMKSIEYSAFMAAQAGLQIAKNFTSLLDAAKEALQLAKEGFHTILTVMEDIVKFGAKAVNIESIVLSGTLRGVIGIQGANSRPLSASVKGHLLGKGFELDLTFDPKDVLSFIKAIFNQLWDLLKGGDQLAQLEYTEGDTGRGSASLALDAPSGSLGLFHPLNSSQIKTPWFESLLPPSQSDFQRSPTVVAPSFATMRAAPMHRPPVSEDQVTFIAPPIPVHDQVKPLPFAVARARFMGYRMQGTTEDGEQAKKLGLVVLPRGPFTAGPPKYA